MPLQPTHTVPVAHDEEQDEQFVAVKRSEGRVSVVVGAAHGRVPSLGLAGELHT